MPRNEEQPTEELDVEAIALSAHDEKLRRYAVFDKLVDRVLDGEVSLDVAISDYKHEMGYDER